LFIYGDKNSGPNSFSIDTSFPEAVSVKVNPSFGIRNLETGIEMVTAPLVEVPFSGIRSFMLQYSSFGFPSQIVNISNSIADDPVQLLPLVDTMPVPLNPRGYGHISFTSSSGFPVTSRAANVTINIFGSWSTVDNSSVDWASAIFEFNSTERDRSCAVISQIGRAD
jgi:hypothetical protein